MTWKKETIPDRDMVYRQVHILDAPKKSNRRIPNEAHFSPDADGLSVHWDRYISIHDIYIIISLSNNRDGKYLNYTLFKVYQFPVHVLRSLDGIHEVKHDPVINGNPAPVGKPNNRAHSLVVYPDDAEIRLKLSDYVSDHYSDCYCDFEIKSLDKEINGLRDRLNNTDFHRVLV